MNGKAFLSLLDLDSSEPLYVIVLCGREILGARLANGRLHGSNTGANVTHFPSNWVGTLYPGEVREAPLPADECGHSGCLGVISAPDCVAAASGAGDVWDDAAAMQLLVLLDGEGAPVVDLALRRAGTGIGALAGAVTNLFGPIRVVLAGPETLVAVEDGDVTHRFHVGLDRGVEASLHGALEVDWHVLPLSANELAKVEAAFRRLAGL